MPLIDFSKPPARGAFDHLLKPIEPWTRRKPTAPETPSVPPPPPERGGGTPRIRIEIEIVDRRQQTPPRRGYRFGTLTLWLLVLAGLIALAGCAHAQGQRWQSYDQGFERHYQSNDGWSGTSYKQGFTTFYNFNGPDGRNQHCRSWKQGWQEFSECD